MSTDHTFGAFFDGGVSELVFEKSVKNVTRLYMQLVCALPRFAVGVKILRVVGATEKKTRYIRKMELLKCPYGSKISYGFRMGILAIPFY